MARLTETYELYCAKCEAYLETTQREGNCPKCGVAYEVRMGVYLTDVEKREMKGRKAGKPKVEVR